MLNWLSTFSGSGAWSMVTDLSGFWGVSDESSIYKERVFLVFAFPKIWAQRTGLTVDPKTTNTTEKKLIKQQLYCKYHSLIKIW